KPPTVLTRALGENRQTLGAGSNGHVPPSPRRRSASRWGPQKFPPTVGPSGSSSSAGTPASHSGANTSASSRGVYPSERASSRDHQRRVLSETPHTTRNPGAGALRQDSTRFAQSSGDSQVPRPCRPSGRGPQ